MGGLILLFRLIDYFFFSISMGVFVPISRTVRTVDTSTRFDQGHFNEESYILKVSVLATGDIFLLKDCSDVRGNDRDSRSNGIIRFKLTIYGTSSNKSSRAIEKNNVTMISIQSKIRAYGGDIFWIKSFLNVFHKGIKPRISIHITGKGTDRDKIAILRAAKQIVLRISDKASSLVEGTTTELFGNSGFNVFILTIINQFLKSG